MSLYLIPNFAMQTNAAPVAVTTGNAIKTMLQFKPSATIAAKIAGWSISFDGLAASTIKCELIEADNPATVTASVAADITKFGNEALAGGDPTTNLIVVGTTATGYTASGEGTTPTAVRNLDDPFFAAFATGQSFQYKIQFPLGREPACQVSKFIRIRVTASVAVNCYCSLLVEI